MVTIYDVAQAAGVSPATVSRVFSGQARVSEDRVRAVREAAEALEFVPNRNARRLRTSSSEIIALMVPDIANTFFTGMTRAVEDVARQTGYSVMLCNTDDDPARELEYLRVATSEPVAGIIMVPTLASRLDWAIEREVPVVCVDRPSPLPGVDTVVANNVDSSAMAAGLLYQAGRSRLACVTGPADIETSNQRLAGWSRMVRQHTGDDPDPRLILRGSFVLDADGERATRRLMSLQDPPDGIFAANNRLATGALRALTQLHLAPPAVGLVSFGGPPQMLLPLPGLITTYLPTRAMGATAARMLIDRIDGLDTEARFVTLPVSLEKDDGEILSTPSPPLR